MLRLAADDRRPKAIERVVIIGRCFSSSFDMYNSTLLSRTCHHHQHHHRGDMAMIDHFSSYIL
jgi:hypothetical protein